MYQNSECMETRQTHTIGIGIKVHTDTVQAASTTWTLVLWATRNTCTSSANIHRTIQIKVSRIDLTTTHS